MDLGSQLCSCFGTKALAALDLAAGQARQGRPMDTLDVFLALTVIDATAPWRRIWQEFGELDLWAAGRHADPSPLAGALWNGQPVTVTCGTAIRAAVVLADEFGLLPVPAGVLALCLVGEPATGASCALGATSEQRHSMLLGLVQEALVGSSWRDVTSILRQCFAHAAKDGADAGEDSRVQRVADDMAGELEALLEVLGQFLGTDSPAASGMLLEQHPELLSARIDVILAQAIRQAGQAGDDGGARRLREHRDFLGNYRRLTGKTLPEEAAVRRYAECRPGDHLLENSVWQEPGYLSTAIRCAACHVGCLVDVRKAEDGVIRAEYFIFPADGCDEISAEMKTWATATCERTLRDLEDQGFSLLRSPPAIGQRPGSLRRHVNFTRAG